MANVLYERVGAASVLTIDRPERRNAIDGQTAEELLAGYRSFESDEDAHVLVVTGSGEKAFSAGADLKAIETLGPRVNSVEGVLGFTRRGSAVRVSRSQVGRADPGWRDQAPGGHRRGFQSA
jgi:enoyl-CoA hydratase/carnithine racemase